MDKLSGTSSQQILMWVKSGHISSERTTEHFLAVGSTTGITYAISQFVIPGDAILTYYKDGVRMNPPTTHSSRQDAIYAANAFDKSVESRLI